MAYTQALISCSTAVVDNRGFRSAPMSTNNELVHSTSICGSMALTGVSGEIIDEWLRRLYRRVTPMGERWQDGHSWWTKLIPPAARPSMMSSTLQAMRSTRARMLHQEFVMYNPLAPILSRHASILWCERNLYIMPFNGDARQVPTIKVNGKLLGTGETGPLHAGSEIRFSDDLFDPFSAWLVTGISEGEPISVPPSAGDTMKTVVSHLCVACLVVVISKAYKR
ncbi:hypothetical protein IWX50DRAFT_656339 [Phyllosticta citricarpa]